MTTTDTNKPWEGETPPAPAGAPAAVGDPVENANAEADQTVATIVDIHVEPAPAPKPIKVVKGAQAPLALINLVSQGFTMKEAKKKLGMK